MLKAVVFDMDDTLLSINLSAFLAVYVRDEARLTAGRSTTSTRTNETRTTIASTMRFSQTPSGSGAACPSMIP